MRLFTLLAFLSLFGSGVYGQSDLYIIKLKNGIAIKAELIKVVPDSFVLIKQYGLETKINMTDILTIIYDETNPLAYSKRTRPKVFKRPIPDSGWSFGYQFGFTLGRADIYFTTSSFVTRLIALKKVGKRTQVGFAAGADPYDFYSIAIGSVSLDARHYLSKGSNAMFTYGYSGYGFNLSNPNSIKYGGWNYGIGLGHSLRTKNQKVLSIMAGYKRQYAKEESYPRNRPSYTKYLTLSRVEFKLECLF